jgi:hypothetical protein
MNRFLPLAACSLLLLAAPRLHAQTSDRVALFPQFRAGETFRYRIGFRSQIVSSTESTVASPQAPVNSQTDAQFFLFAEVVDVHQEAGKDVMRFRTKIVQSDASAPAKTVPSPLDLDSNSPLGKLVGFTLHAGGQATNLDGFDGLSVDERAAWQEWLSRFAAAATFPDKGIKPGDKWKSEEPTPATPLGGLSWDKESVYVSDAPCTAVSITPEGDISPLGQPLETCAVILTTATLKQKSPSKDATPDDYRLHDLRTTGTATGKNQIVSYISLKTGFVLRSTEDANQSMNVVVAKTDTTNRVHYAIGAESHAQILLLSEPTSDHP